MYCFPVTIGGALLIKFMAVGFIVTSIGMTLVAVREAIEDSQYI